MARGRGEAEGEVTQREKGVFGDERNGPRLDCGYSYMPVSVHQNPKNYMPQRVNFTVRNVHKEMSKTELSICTPMFLAVLFTAAKRWTQPKCPSADE